MVRITQAEYNMESGDDNAEKQSEEEIYNEDAVYIEDTVTTHLSWQS